MTTTPKLLVQQELNVQRRSGIRQQHRKRRSQRWQITLDYAPYDAIINRGIGVDQNIAERYDPTMVLYLLGYLWIVLCQLREGFAHDLELAFDSGTKQFVAPVFVETFAVAKPRDAHHCLLNIENILSRLKPHRAGFFLVPRAAGNKDCEGWTVLSGLPSEKTERPGSHAKRNRRARTQPGEVRQDRPESPDRSLYHLAQLIRITRACARRTAYTIWRVQLVASRRRHAVQRSIPDPCGKGSAMPHTGKVKVLRALPRIC